MIYRVHCTVSKYAWVPKHYTPEIVTETKILSVVAGNEEAAENIAVSILSDRGYREIVPFFMQAEPESEGKK